MAAISSIQLHAPGKAKALLSYKPNAPSSISFSQSVKLHSKASPFRPLVVQVSSTPPQRNKRVVFPLSSALAENWNIDRKSYEESRELLQKFETWLRKNRLRWLYGKRLEQTQENGEEAYIASLQLVEWLIYRGEYKIAEIYCQDYVMKDRPPNDRRPYFYLAVAKALLGKTRESQAQWEEFEKIDEELRPPMESDSNQ